MAITESDCIHRSLYTERAVVATTFSSHFPCSEQSSPEQICGPSGSAHSSIGKMTGSSSACTARRRSPTAPNYEKIGIAQHFDHTLELSIVGNHANIAHARPLLIRLQQCSFRSDILQAPLQGQSGFLFQNAHNLPTGFALQVFPIML